MDIVADEPKDLEMTPEQLKAHRALVTQAVQAVRLASLRPLRLPVLAVGRRWAATAPSITVERGRHRGRLLHRVGREGAWPRPARARVHAFVERQVPPPGRSVRHPTSTCRWAIQLLWVYEGQTQYWGFVLDARARACGRRAVPRRARADVRRNYDRNRPGFQWRTLRGHDQRSDRGAAPIAAVSQLADERGLLQRRAR